MTSDTGTQVRQRNWGRQKRAGLQRSRHWTRLPIFSISEIGSLHTTVRSCGWSFELKFSKIYFIYYVIVPKLGWLLVSSTKSALNAIAHLPHLRNRVMTQEGTNLWMEFYCLNELKILQFFSSDTCSFPNLAGGIAHLVHYHYQVRRVLNLFVLP